MAPPGPRPRPGAGTTAPAPHCLLTRSRHRRSHVPGGDRSRAGSSAVCPAGGAGAPQPWFHRRAAGLTGLAWTILRSVTSGHQLAVALKAERRPVSLLVALSLGT